MFFKVYHNEMMLFVSVYILPVLSLVFRANKCRLDFRCFGTFRHYSSHLSLDVNHEDPYLNHLTGSPFPVPGEKQGFSGGGSTTIFQIPILGQKKPPLFLSFDYKKSSVGSDGITYK